LRRNTTIPGIRYSWLWVVATFLLAQTAAAQRPGAGSNWKTDFTRSSVDLREITSGGPPKDGIPSIDRPKFIAVDAASWLGDREPVMVVSHGGETKIYPIQILIWHEIVNDVVGGRPTTVTFCPLCNTALVFDRRLNGRVLDFGTTGQLRHSDLVMYDRQTETWWQQASGEGIVGELTGKELVRVDAQMVAWGEARRNFPTAKVLSRETGYRREYGRNPYARYDNPGQSPIAAFFSRKPDPRLPAMERVVTLESKESPVAYPFSRLSKERVVHDDHDGLPIVVLWKEGTASALDASNINQGRDVGAVGVFESRLDGKKLTFTATNDGRFRDDATGSLWNLFGEAEAGPSKGRRLTPIPHGNHFWFSWVTFRPSTRLAQR
jgi:hypothetical protein